MFPADVRRPNFFIVGAPKCATTSMDKYLSEHPEIYMAPDKEPHFFSRDLYPPEIGLSPEQYASLFKDAKDEPIVGESSVFYMLSEDAARAIHAHDPAARILIMLRNPVDTVISHHSQIVFEGLEDETDLAVAWSLEAQRRIADAGKALTFEDRVRYYREVVNFPGQIERFLEIFPRSQIHFVIFDDLKADVAGEYKKVLRFLGVAEDFQPSFSVENANKKIRSPFLRDFLRYTPDWATRMSRVLLPSQRLRTATKKTLKNLNTKFVPRAEVDAAVRKQLAEDLKADVDKLSALLERDLSSWAQA